MRSINLPNGWPAGRTLAVSVSVMLEGWTDDSAPGIGPMGNPLRSGVLDLQARSWADYGAKVGAWRILDVLAKTDVTAVFYVSGLLAERYPDLMRAITQAGHGIAGHSWGQNIVPAYQTREEEESDLRRCIDALEAASGHRIRGWISPRCTPSTHTSELLAAADFKWHADIFDADLPYPLETPSGRILAVPFTMEVNDMPIYVRYGNEPEAFTRVFERIVSNWPRLESHPACLDITVHAHIFGRPYGALELINTLEIAKRHEERAWLTDHGRLADLFGALR